MLLEVRLFAMLREAGQADRIQVRLEPGSSVAALRTAIAEEFPALAPHLAASRVAANLQFVPDDHLLAEGQEVALIPPVSGG
jgi:molybdopterin converting factor subunit 1